MIRNIPATPMRSAEKGAALAFGLVTATVLSVAGVGASKGSVVQSRMANNYRFSIEAMNSADVGVRNAVTAFNDQALSLDGFDDELDANGNGVLDDRFSVVVADQARNLYYTLVVADDDDGDGDPSVDANSIVRLVSQGTSSLGSTRTIVVRVTDAGFTEPPTILDKAVLAEESITLAGNASYCGSNTDIHSNQNLYGTSNPTTTGTLSASGTAYGGDPTGGGEAVSGAATIEIPEIVPSNFEEYVDYVFMSDGWIYTPDGVIVATSAVTTGSGWHGWIFAGDKWTMTGNDVIEGDLYFKGPHGNVNVSSNPGTLANPWAVSILADGYIQLSGTPVIENYMDPEDPVSIQDILFMAGTDIKISGNVNQTFRGLIAAAEQFDITGNPTLEAAILSGGQDNSATNDSDLVVSNLLSGSMTVCYDGTLAMPPAGNATGVLDVLSWQELEIARGTDVFAPQN